MSEIKTAFSSLASHLDDNLRKVIFHGGGPLPPFPIDVQRGRAIFTEEDEPWEANGVEVQGEQK